MVAFTPARFKTAKIHRNEHSPDFIEAFTRCLEERASCCISKSDMSPAFRNLGIKCEPLSIKIYHLNVLEVDANSFEGAAFDSYSSLVTVGLTSTDIIQSEFFLNVSVNSVTKNICHFS